MGQCRHKWRRLSGNSAYRRAASAERPRSDVPSARFWRSCAGVLPPGSRTNRLELWTQPFSRTVLPRTEVTWFLRASPIKLNETLRGGLERLGHLHRPQVQGLARSEAHAAHVQLGDIGKSGNRPGHADLQGRTKALGQQAGALE